MTNLYNPSEFGLTDEQFFKVAEILYRTECSRHGSYTPFREVSEGVREGYKEFAISAYNAIEVIKSGEL